MRRWTRCIGFPLLLALSLPFGTLCHEVVGHGLTGVLCGGRITYIEVLGFALWPSPHWVGWTGHYGYAALDGVSTKTGELLMSLGGAMSTWLVSVAACLALWLRRWSEMPRTILLVLSFWWIDLFTYTLPSWGLRRSVFWGPIYSEPYEAAVELGIPGPAFQAFVLLSCMALFLATILSRRQRHTGVPLSVPRA